MNYYLSDILALRNEEQEQVNIYIHILHIYCNEWEEFSFIYKEHDYKKNGNTKLSFAHAHSAT